MTIKLAINGFGRIGRVVFRQALAAGDVEIVAINDLAPVAASAHLLKYDSVHGPFQGDVKLDGDKLVVNGKAIALYSTTNVDEVAKHFAAAGAEAVMECTGKVAGPEALNKFLVGSVKKVLLSRPINKDKGEGDIPMFVMGVNHGVYKPEINLLSNASCTTNCLAPVAYVLDKAFGIERGLMTTIHSYTNDQVTLDQVHKDLRRARAAALSMIPTTTGAARAVGKVLPHLNGKLDGFAIRVPTPNVSVVDLVVQFQKSASRQAVNEALAAAAQGELKGVLGYSEEPLVSSDYNGCPLSSIVDAPLTTALKKDGDDLFKVVSWYDNETGYSRRMIDLARFALTGAYTLGKSGCGCGCGA